MELPDLLQPDPECWCKISKWRVWVLWRLILIKFCLSQMSYTSQSSEPQNLLQPSRMLCKIKFFYIFFKSYSASRQLSFKLLIFHNVLGLAYQLLNHLWSQFLNWHGGGARKVGHYWTFCNLQHKETVCNLVFYAHSTITVISGRYKVTDFVGHHWHIFASPSVEH